MLTTKNLAILGTVCVLAVVPITPRSIQDSGRIQLVATASAQTVTKWDNPNDGDWDDFLNWSNGVPNSAVEAEHETETAVITINVANAECAKFTGDASASNDRYALIGVSKKLRVFGDMVRTGKGNDPFVVKFENGTGAAESNMTRLFVDGTVSGFDFIPTTGFGVRGSYVKIDVDGRVSSTGFLLGDDVDIDVGGDVSAIAGTSTWSVEDNGDIDIKGNVTDVAFRVGTTAAGASEGTVVKVGAIGDPSPTHDDCTLRGYASLTVSDDTGYGSGNYAARDLNTLVVQRNNSSMTVEGSTSGATWEMSGQALFTGVGDIFNGVWNVARDARVVGLGDATEGTWTVTSDGGSSGVGVDIAGVFDPDVLAVAAGTVACNALSTSSAVWDTTVKNGGTIEAQDQVWFGDVNDSTLTYSGLGNAVTVTSGFMYIGGEVDQASSGAELDISVQYLVVNPEIVKVVGGSTQTKTFEPEGVSVEIRAGSCSTTARWLEAIGPDYDGFNNDNVLFTDSPCVGRWGDLTFAQGSGTSQCATVADLFRSTPISGGPGTYSDSVYAKDLTISAGVTLKTGVPSNPVNLYHTGTYPNNGTLSGAGTVTQLNTTSYGDFDGDKDSGDDQADVTRFNASWNKSDGDVGFDPLVDWNCDATVDCLDRDHLLANFPNSTGVSGSCP